MSQISVRPARKRGIVRHLVAVTAAILTLVVGTGQPAMASAYGVQSWGSFCVSGKCFPSGVLEHEVQGSGRSIWFQWAEAESAANICNWRMDFVFYDTNNTLYYRNTGSTHYSCTRVAYRSDGTDRYVRYGKTCAEIYANSTRLARQCHYITA